MADGFQRAGLHRGVLAVVVAALAQGRTGFQHLVAEAVAFTEQQQALVVEQLGVDGLQLRPGMAGWQQGVEGLVVQRLGQYVGLMERQGDDDGVELTGEQFVTQDMGEVFLDI